MAEEKAGSSPQNRRDFMTAKERKGVVDPKTRNGTNECVEKSSKSNKKNLD
jgi:hypothetical protein